MNTVLDTGATDIKYFTFDPRNPNTIIGYVYSESAPKDVVVPSKYIDSGGVERDILHIGSSAFAGQTITSIRLNDNLSSIGANAFYNSQLRSIHMGDSNTAIGTDAFKNCNVLESVTFGEGVTAISAKAFINCKALTTLTVGEQLKTIGESAFRNTGLTSVRLPNSVTSLGAFVFADTTNLQTATIGTGLTDISQYAFSNSGLTKIEIPGNVETIGAYAFRECKGLHTLTLNEGLKTINVYAFNDAGVQALVLPDSLTALEEGAFFGADALLQVTFGSGLKSIGARAFQVTGLTSVEIPANVTSIGAVCFNACKDLSTVTFREGVVTIGSDAFSSTGITTVTLPDSVTDIGMSAFYNTSKLESFHFGNQIKAIPEKMLQDSALQKVDIPANIKSIEKNAFASCKSLKEVTFREGLESIGANAFGSTALESIVLPNSLTAVGESVFGSASKLEQVTFGSGLTYISNNMFTYTGSLTSITIPDTIVQIGEGAFREGALKSIGIPSSVKSIGGGAFAYTELASVVIPNSVENIGDIAFQKTQLVNVTIPSSVTSLGKSAFAECALLTDVDLQATIEELPGNIFFKCIKLKNITLPNGLKRIGEAAFASTAIEHMIIPDSVTTLGTSVFANNYSLKHVDLGSGVTAIPDKTFYDTGITSFLITEQIESVGDEAFGYSRIQNITLPEKPTYGKRLFANARSLQTVTFEEGITAIPEETFAGATVKTINFPDSLTEIKEKAFSRAQISTLTIPGQITNIAADALASDNLKKIYLKEREYKTLAGNPWGAVKAQIYWKETDDLCFYTGPDMHIRQKPIDHANCTQGNDHSTVTVPSQRNGVDIVGIEPGGFRYNQEIKKMILPDTLQVIGNQAFESSILEEINIPGSVKVIPKSGFYEAKKLKTVSIEAGVEKIEDGAFGQCTVLTSVQLPETVKEIGTNVFRDTAIEELILPNSLTTFGSFGRSSKLKKITVGAGMETLSFGTQFEVCYDVNQVLFAPNSTLKTLSMSNASSPGKVRALVVPKSVTSISGFSGTWDSITFEQPSRLTFEKYVFRDLKKSYLALPENAILKEYVFGDATLEEVILPNSTNIENAIYAFEGNEKLKRIRIPETATAIPRNFLENTAIEEIVIPEGVKTINESAFRTTKLKQITLPNGLTSIKNSAFAGCSNLTSVRIPGSVETIASETFANVPLTNITIEEGTKSIRNDAFKGAQPKVLNLPSTIEQIDGTAFRGATIDTIYVDRLRNECAFRVEQPWGATANNVYYKGEYAEFDYTVVDSPDETKPYERIIQYTVTAPDAVGLISEITLPNGNKISGISKPTYSGEYKVERSGDYEFGIFTGGSGDAFNHVAVVGDIGNVEISANDILIGKDELADPTLTMEKIFEFAGAAAKDTDVDVELAVTTTRTVAELQSRLVNVGDKIDVDIKATSAMAQSASASFQVTLVDKVHTVKFYDSSQLLKTVRVENNAKLDTYALDNKTNVTFLGWNETATPDTLWNFADVVTRSMSLHAKWKEHTYRVLYETGFPDLTIKAKTNVKWQDADLLPEEPHREGYTFEGWKYNDAFVSKSDKFSDLSASADDQTSITLTAQWIRQIHKVEFVYVGDTPVGIRVPEKIDINYGDSIDSPIVEDVTAWTMKGWYTDREQTEPYYFGTSVKDDFTLYGSWKEHSYEVKYDTGFPELFIESKTGVKWQQSGLLPANPSKKGYLFKGWQLGERKVSETDRFSDLSADSSDLAFITLTAQWQLEEDKPGPENPGGENPGEGNPGENEPPGQDKPEQDKGDEEQDAKNEGMTGAVPKVDSKTTTVKTGDTLKKEMRKVSGMIFLSLVAIIVVLWKRRKRI